MSEKISELIDERGARKRRDDLFDHIIADAGAGRTWRHYHLIGCVLRGEVGPGAAAGDITARIESRIKAEAPAAVARPGAVVVRRPRRRAWRAAAKAGAAATLALAASLAVVAVIVLRPGPEAGGAQVAQPSAARFNAEFGEMLAQHGEFASAPGLNGLIVHAKFVSNQPVER